MVGISGEVIGKVFTGAVKKTIDILAEAKFIVVDRSALNGFIAGCINSDYWTSENAATIEYGFSNSTKKTYAGRSRFLF